MGSGSRSLIDAGLRIYARVDELGKEQPMSPQLWLCKRSMINLQKAGLVYDLPAIDRERGMRCRNVYSPVTDCQPEHPKTAESDRTDEDWQGG